VLAPHSASTLATEGIVLIEQIGHRIDGRLRAEHYERFHQQGETAAFSGPGHLPLMDPDLIRSRSDATSAGSQSSLRRGRRTTNLSVSSMRGSSPP
jgi:hypothetical protein